MLSNLIACTDRKSNCLWQVCIIIVKYEHKKNIKYKKDNANYKYKKDKAN